MLPGEDRAARRVLTVCLAAGATTLLDQSVLNIAVPALRQSLSADATDVQWIVSGYSLAFGLALVPGGSLGDVRGRKHLFLVGLSTFVLCGLVAATGTRATTVVVARLVQGAGAGLVNSQVIGTLQDVFHGLDRARALGLYAVTGGGAAALGPALGGTLVTLCGPGTGWRLCLLLSAPCGVLTLWLAARRLPPPRRVAAPGRVDLWGLVCVAALTLSLMLPFISTPDSGRAVALWAAAALVAAGALVLGQRWRVRRGRVPLVHPSLIRSAPYALGTSVAMANFGASLAAGLVLTLFLQSGLGLSALTTAAVTLPSAVAMGVSSAVAWRVVRRIGARTVTLGLSVGVLALLGGAVAAVTLPLAALPLALAGVQVVSGAASGLTVSPNQARVLQHAPADAAGVAGGILQMTQRIAAAVCLSAVSGIYLRGSAGAEGEPRTAFAVASVVCAGLLAAALLVCVALPRVSSGAGRVRGRAGVSDRAASEAP
ncbi:MFS transporter [Streptomyces rishiriensis]|uniref:MFS family permease n=1 Tax=Streptomyces rishiriensis TaxID=68264 RepID=A0ABU0P185_STRRH|nr:MFS transporter [Streptomyces rishiriensis]MDQ0584773.1 MFS family permease [Streptomyces rishiriensis]